MSDPPVTVIGSYISPYVRKVLACLDLKAIAYQIDPIIPFFGNDEFGRISPVRRIPILIDGSVTVCDSTVICEYLEERRPDRPVYPATREARARARWLEEFADTRMGEVFVWRLFNEIVIRRFVWGEETDQSVVRNTLQVEIPEVLDYLEGELPSDGSFFFGEFGIADISVAAFFRNAEFAGFSLDAGRWPRTAAFVDRAFEHPSLRKLRPFEDRLMKTPIPRHREALAELGAPLTPQSLGTTSPRRGILNI